MMRSLRWNEEVSNMNKNSQFKELVKLFFSYWEIISVYLDWLGFSLSTFSHQDIKLHHGSYRVRSLLNRVDIISLYQDKSQYLLISIFIFCWFCFSTGPKWMWCKIIGRMDGCINSKQKYCNKENGASYY